MDGREVPWWLWLVIGLVALAAVVVGAIYLQKSRSLSPTLTQQEVGVPSADLQPTIDWGIRKMHENEEYRSVRIVGVIEDVTTEGTNTYLYLKNQGDAAPGGVRVNLGKDQSELGVSFQDTDVSNTERTWSNAKLAETKEKLVIGSRAEVEVITWLKPDYDCEGNALCIERVVIYQKHEEDNAQLDLIMYDISDSAVVNQFSTRFSGLTFGPVNTLMVVQ